MLEDKVLDPLVGIDSVELQFVDAVVVVVAHDVESPENVLVRFEDGIEPAAVLNVCERLIDLGKLGPPVGRGEALHAPMATMGELEAENLSVKVVG